MIWGRGRVELYNLTPQPGCKLLKNQRTTLNFKTMMESVYQPLAKIYPTKLHHIRKEKEGWRK